MRAGEPDRGARADVDAVRRGRVVHEDLDGPLVPDRHGLARSAGRPSPSQSMIGGGSAAAGGAGAERDRCRRGPAAGQDVPPRQPSHPHRPHRVPRPSTRTMRHRPWPAQRRARRCDPSSGGMRSTGRGLSWLPISNMLVLPTGRNHAVRSEGPWATSGATCATSSSTSSRSSACRTGWAAARSTASTSTPRATRSRELNAVAHRAAGRVLRRRRPQPAGLRPGDLLRHAAGVAEGRLQGAVGRRVVAARACRSSWAATASRRPCSGPPPS